MFALGFAFGFAFEFGFVFEFGFAFGFEFEFGFGFGKLFSLHKPPKPLNKRQELTGARHSARCQ